MMEDMIALAGSVFARYGWWYDADREGWFYRDNTHTQPIPQAMLDEFYDTIVNDELPQRVKT